MLVTGIIACGAVFCLTGCETYKKSPACMPDGFNYTFAVDHQAPHDTWSYVGLSWSLK
jgi:hypothetical protein